MRSIQTSVCVLTSRGMSAIASIALAGADARAILGKIFRAATGPSQEGLPEVSGGDILHGSIIDGDRVIDQVVIGHERADCFVIHCHGNPLLVEQIVKLLQSHGAVLTETDKAAFRRYAAGSNNMIEAEAKLAIQKAATLLGVKILQAQIKGGFCEWAQETLEKIGTLNPEAIKQQCHELLEHSRIAKYITEGVRIVLAGPPNSGKSTLLNCLAGQQQVIVCDTAGTTRDWVSVICHLGDSAGTAYPKIHAEILDTAGLDDVLAHKDDIERVAQKTTQELLDSCDLILYVQDVTADDGHRAQIKIDTNKPIIYVSNKSDLIGEHRDSVTQELKSQVPTLKPVYVSAQENTGIDVLARQIIGVLGLRNFKHTRPILFTPRQYNLITELLTAHRSAQSILRDLLSPESTGAE